MSDHTYKQAPYENCTEEQYNELRALVPESIDWDSFREYDDNVEGAQQLACTAGSCEI
jgi:ribonucleoside-diphosphate reductase alpha chain